MKKTTTRLDRLWQWFVPLDNRDDESAPLAEGEDPFADPVVWEITDTIDLHSVAPREMKAVVEAYLEEIYRRGFTRVRIIHGKGKGVQREAVRRILARTSFVQKFHDAADGSGWGATIAVLKKAEENDAMTEGNRL